MDTIRPSYTEADLGAILVSKEEIAERVGELAEEVSMLYADHDVTIVSVMSGALIFTADLMRQIKFPTRLDCIRAESYGSGTEAKEPPRITNPLKTDVAGKHVLVVDDILDTGRTLRAILAHLEQASPASLRTCVLLDK